MAVGPLPAVARRLRLAEVAHDARDLTFLDASPVAEPFAREEVPAAERTERHCPTTVGRCPDGAGRSRRPRSRAYSRGTMPSRQGFRAPRPDAQGPAERENNVVELARQAVERLSARLPGIQVYCHMRVGEALRVVASVGGLRLIYEIPREQGGICWRAAESGKPQLVEDVRDDPDYLATDERVRSEVAIPVQIDEDTLLVLDAEFTERTFTPEEAEAVEAEAARLASEIV